MKLPTLFRRHPKPPVALANLPPEVRSGIIRALLTSQAALRRGGSWRYAQYASEGYLANYVTNACIGRIMQACSSVGLRLRVGEDEYDVAASEVPLALRPLARLLRRPNPMQAQDEFVQTWALHLHLGGIAFARLFGAGQEPWQGTMRSKTSPEMWLIRPDRMEIMHDDANVLTGYKLDHKIIVPPDQVVHWKFTNPNTEWEGLSPLCAIEGLIDLTSNAVVWNTNLFRNSGVPGGVLSIKDLNAMPETERKRTREEFATEFAGVQNAGKIFVTGADIAAFTALATSAKELDWVASKRDLMRDICGVLGVPSKLLNDPEAGTYANYQEARKAFYIETILPLMQHFVGELNEQLVPMYGADVEVLLDAAMIDVLQEDRNALYQRLQGAAWLTIDEKREQTGYDVIDGGDVLTPVPTLTALTSLLSPASRLARSAAPADVRGDSLFPTLETRATMIVKREAQRSPWERRYKRTLRDFWNDQQAQVLDLIDRTRSTAAPEAHVDPLDLINLSDDVERMAEELLPLAERMRERFGQTALDMVKDDALFVWDEPAARKALANDLAQRSKLINDATAAAIKQQLSLGMQANEGAQQLRDRITNLYDGFSEVRAENIARTEVGRAQSIASLEGWEQGEVSHKEWITWIDDRTRETHVAMDGVIVPLDAPFHVGGDLMMAPRMGSEPEENCNCRCDTGPIVAE